MQVYTRPHLVFLSRGFQWFRLLVTFLHRDQYPVNSASVVSQQCTHREQHLCFFVSNRSGNFNNHNCNWHWSRTSLLFLQRKVSFDPKFKVCNYYLWYEERWFQFLCQHCHGHKEKWLIATYCIQQIWARYIFSPDYKPNEVFKDSDFEDMMWGHSSDWQHGECDNKLVKPIVSVWVLEISEI